MRRLLPLPLVIVLLGLLWSGCTSSRPASEPDSTATASGTDSSRSATFQHQQAFVYVDGTERGVTPTTVTIKRGFGETMVTLHVLNRQGDSREVRRFEVERVPTSNKNMLDYSFRADYFGDVRSYDVQDLPTTKDGTYIIPYYDTPVQIEDRQYMLTLLVKH